MNLKTAILFVLLIINYSCNVSQEGTDCSLVDCAIEQWFSIELVDASGNNLITNGTYSLSEISINYNESEVDVIPFNSNDFLNFIVENKSGESIYTIRFSESEIDTLNLNLVELNQTSECCGPYFDIETATYNTTDYEVLPNENRDFFKITIIKP
ncbi:hypothetical protein [Maribacter dokdonensis]|uniref:hypothetical protein n=1 Tax=Maribacter dokdonensis TaxID=320912 RepID=UPI0027335DFF|nr:hypothetical protein [Maribacter dokdonensis]MDP2525983.1 hypothetical protein [Maribacter dokdonensis]